MRPHISHDDLKVKRFSNDAEPALTKAIKTGRGVTTATPAVASAVVGRNPVSSSKSYPPQIRAALF